MREAEARRVVTGLAKAQARKGGAATAFKTDDQPEIETIPLPGQEPWPTLHPGAWHGLAGEIVHALEPETEADPVAILIILLVNYGNCVGRGPHYVVESSKHHANLFAAVVGQSAKGRKGTAEDRVLGLFDGLDDVWKAGCITTGLSSGEGLIWNVRDPVEALEPVKEKGKVVGYQQVTRDGGVSDKRLLVSESELAQALQVLKREGNTLSPVLRQAWDRGTLKALTKNNSAAATDAHVSILGSITETELKKLLDENNLLNGFANRFLWLLVKRSKQLPDGGRQLDLSRLRKALTEAFEKARAVGRMERSPACRGLWHGLYPDLTQERPGLYGAVVARAEAQTLRLSMLYALLEGSAVIDLPHLRAAHAVWRYCDDSARRIFGQRTQEAEDALPTLLLQVMRQSPGVNRKGMYKALGGHVKAVEVVAALAKLRAQGKAECRTVATGGRRSECWWATEVASGRTKAPVSDAYPRRLRTNERSTDRRGP